MNIEIITGHYLAHDQTGPLPAFRDDLYSLDVSPEQFERRIRDREKQQKSHGNKLAFLEGQRSLPKPENWMKRNSYWISPAAALIGMLLGTGFVIRFFSFTVDERIAAKLDNPLKDFHKLQTDVSNINGQLDTFMDMARDRLNKLGSLQPALFRGILPSVGNALQDAGALSVSVAPQVKAEIQRNFQKVPSEAPGYWPAVGQYITYSSDQRAGFTRRALPSCRSIQPKVIEGDIDNPAVPKSFRHYHLLFQDCSLALDDNPLDVWIARAFLLAANITVFQNCVVTYDGGPIDEMMGIAIFDNCFYKVRLDGPPRQRGALMISQLLEDDRMVKLRG